MIMAKPNDTPADMPDDIKNILGPNENVELYIKEKIYHPQINIDSLIITNTRIILRHPHAAQLKRDYSDYSYSDFLGVELEKGAMRSTIKLLLKPNGKSLDLGRLPTPLAEQGYGIIREHVGEFQALPSTEVAIVPPLKVGSANIVEEARVPDETPKASPKETGQVISSMPVDPNPQSEKPGAKISEEAPAKMSDESIVAVASKDEEEGEETPEAPKAMKSKTKTVSNKPVKRTDETIAAVPSVEEKKNKKKPKASGDKTPKVQSDKRPSAKRVAKPVAAVNPVGEEEDEKKPKGLLGKGPKAMTKEKNGQKEGALPIMEEAPGKSEPTANNKGSSSAFGWVELQGTRYDFDVIVHVDGSVTKREKETSKKKKEKYGHTPLTRKELKELGEEGPDMIIIGTGHNGAMPLTPKAERFLEDYLSFVGKTPKALEKLVTGEKKAVALLHVTC